MKFNVKIMVLGLQCLIFSNCSVKATMVSEVLMKNLEYSQHPIILISGKNWDEKLLDNLMNKLNAPVIHLKPGALANLNRNEFNQFDVVLYDPDELAQSSVTHLGKSFVLRVHYIFTKSNAQVVSFPTLKSMTLLTYYQIGKQCLIKIVCDQKTKDVVSKENPLQSTESLKCSNILQNKDLEISITGLPPYTIFKSNGEITGIDFEILKILVNRLKFNPMITREKVWGTETSPGIWSGVVGKVMNETSHLGIGQLIMEMKRHEVVDFCFLLYPMTIKLISLKPRALPPSLNFLRPFSLTVWIALLGTLVLASFVFVIFSAIWNLKSPQYSCTIAMELLLEQVMKESKIRIWSYRVLLGSWCLFSVLIVSSYNCNLRATLMKVNFEKRIDSEQDILDLNRRLYLPIGTPFIHLMKTSPLEVQRALYLMAKKDDLFFYPQRRSLFPAEVEERILSNRDVFFLSEVQAPTIFEALAERHDGYLPYVVGNKPLFNFYTGLIVPKRSLYKIQIDKICQALVESGIVDHITDTFKAGKYDRNEKLLDRPEVFSVDHISGALITWTGFVLLSILVFVIEKMSYST